MGHPQVFLNCATSRDGRLAAADGSPVRFSDDKDMERVHRLRAACDAILVGIGTVLTDDPHLTVKSGHAPSSREPPLRVILDVHGRIPADARILDDAAPTLIFTGPDAPSVPGGRQMRVSLDHQGRLDLDQVLRELVALGVRTLMVEGGEAVLRSFLEAGCWDRFTLFESAEVQGGDGPRLWGVSIAELGLEGTALPQGSGMLWTFSP